MSQSNGTFHGADPSNDPLLRDELVPLVYEELKRLASSHLRHESPGHTLQTTALVHEAYLRLAGGRDEIRWQNRAHFFAAAGEAMRRILIDRARHRKTLKAGGQRMRETLSDDVLGTDSPDFDWIEFDEALTDLERHEPQAAQLIKLRFFAGFGHQEAASAMQIERRVADRLWALGKAWLYRRLREPNETT